MRNLASCSTEWGGGGGRGSRGGDLIVYPVIVSVKLVKCIATGCQTRKEIES